MWLGAVVLSTLLCGTLGGIEEIFDVTTIYNITNVPLSSGEVSPLENPSNGMKKRIAVPGRVHSRTNARGLPLPGVSLAPQSHRSYNLTCDPSAGTCSWNTQEWSKETLPDPSSWIEMDDESIYSFSDSKEFKINQIHAFGKRLVILTPTNTRTPYDSNRVIVLKFDGHSVTFYDRCSTTEHAGYHHPYAYQGSGFYCGVALFSKNIIEGDLVSLEFEGGQIRMSHKESYESGFVGTWRARRYDGPAIKYFYSVTPQNSIPSSISIPRVKILRSTNSSSITSPRFSPDSRELCLLLMIHSEQDVHTDLLHILSQDSVNNVSLLGAINDIKSGWTMRHVDLTLPEDIVPPIQLVVRHTGGAEVNLGLISSCSPGGEDAELDSHVSLDKQGIITKDLTVIAPRHSLIKLAEREDSNKTCLNGGVSTSAGCACPPGFTGPQCEAGCGENRFGQDCGGLCSVRTRECEGLMLCTPYTGCQCAPGFIGDYCNSHCPPWLYGNDCSLTCGHCAGGSPCDIYTGRCLGCEPGYVLPFCKQGNV